MLAETWPREPSNQSRMQLLAGMWQPCPGKVLLPQLRYHQQNLRPLQPWRRLERIVCILQGLANSFFARRFRQQCPEFGFGLKIPVQASTAPQTQQLERWFAPGMRVTMTDDLPGDRPSGLAGLGDHRSCSGALAGEKKRWPATFLSVTQT